MLISKIEIKTKEMILKIKTIIKIMSLRIRHKIVMKIYIKTRTFRTNYIKKKD
jgi:hypothetical protein